MKILDRLSILLFNLCLVLLAVLLPVLAVASSPAYYEARFHETGIYSTVQDGVTYRKLIRYVGGDRTQSATFTDEQIDEIINHMVAFFFGKKANFALTMDGVFLNGEMQDDVQIFGEVACKHMQDVKDLFRLLMVVSAVALLLLIGCIVYFCKRPKRFTSLLYKYSLGFYLFFVGFILLFCVWTLFTLPQMDTLSETLSLFPDMLWTNMHQIFFLFSPEDISGSFFNDTVTMILTLDFFMTTVFIILAILAAVVIAWLIVAYVLKRKLSSAK